MICENLDLETILRLINIIVIIALAILTWFIPSKIQKNIYNKNLIKENFKNDIYRIIELLEKINQLLWIGKKPNLQEILLLEKDIGASIHFLFFDMKKEIFFIKKKDQKLIDSIDKKYNAYQDELTENLPKTNFKVTQEFSTKVNAKKIIFLKELKSFIYSTFSK